LLIRRSFRRPRDHTLVAFSLSASDGVATAIDDLMQVASSARDLSEILEVLVSSIARSGREEDSMKRMGSWMTAACAVSALCLATAALAQAPGSPPETIVSATSTVTATVVSVDQKTRVVTLKSEDGREYSFVAGDTVKNLDQVKAGDLVTTTYRESLVYEVKKGGKAAEAESTTTVARGRPGEVPVAVWAKRTTWTVEITAIDPTIPTITFKGPEGNVRTMKVQNAANLEGISVGDTVEVTWTDAVMIKVERAPKN
jgi:hypothetical protein